MLKIIMLFFIASSSFASDVTFKSDYDRSLEIVKKSKEERAKTSANAQKREVASMDSNIIDETGELDAFLANAESELEKN